MRIVLIIFAVSALQLSCKNNPPASEAAAAKADTAKMEEITLPPPTMGKLDGAFIKLAEEQVIEPNLENKIWHYSFALSLKEETPKDNIYKGHWLDLKPKGEYSKGIYGETTESGRYVFNSKAGLLELRSSDGKSSEWKVKVDPASMIMIGTAKYGNNPWQMKLSRKDSLPVKE